MVGIRFSQIEYYQLGRHTYYAEEWQIEDFKKVGKVRRCLLGQH